ncbi:MAG: hypothetical protein ACYCYK_09185 [Candidatus Dormibacteria bacterium]
MERAAVPSRRVQTVGQALSTAGSHLLTHLPQLDGPDQGQVMSPIRLDRRDLEPCAAAPKLGSANQQLRQGQAQELEGSQAESLAGRAGCTGHPHEMPRRGPPWWADNWPAPNVCTA